MTTETVRVKSAVAPFGIEADGPRNNDLLIQTIAGCKLRGRIVANRGTIVNNRDEYNTPVVNPDQVAVLGQLPEIPGMQLHVNPENGAYLISDPLEDNEELCERIRRFLEKRGYVRRVGGKVRGMPVQRGKLGPDEMKTLVREMVHCVEAGYARVCKGVLPKMEDVDKLPGDYLLNPGCRIHTDQPRYEKDFDEWRSKLNRLGV